VLSTGGDALLFCEEVVFVPTTSSIGELLAPVCVVVVEVSWEGTTAVPDISLQLAHLFPRDALHNLGTGEGDAVHGPHLADLVLLTPAIVVLAGGLTESFSPVVHLAAGPGRAADGVEADMRDTLACTPTVSTAGEPIVVLLTAPVDEPLTDLGGGVVVPGPLLDPT
jgi:hypothetical protein